GCDAGARHRLRRQFQEIIDVVDDALQHRRRVDEPSAEWLREGLKDTREAADGRAGAAGGVVPEEGEWKPEGHADARQRLYVRPSEAVLELRHGTRRHIDARRELALSRSAKLARDRETVRVEAVRDGVNVVSTGHFSSFVSLFF